MSAAMPPTAQRRKTQGSKGLNVGVQAEVAAPDRQDSAQLAGDGKRAHQPGNTWAHTQLHGRMLPTSALAGVVATLLTVLHNGIDA